MEAFLIVGHDSHCDDWYKAYRSRARALREARKMADEMQAQRGWKKEDVNSDLTPSMEKDGWIFFERWGESYSVLVQKIEVML